MSECNGNDGCEQSTKLEPIKQNQPPEVAAALTPEQNLENVRQIRDLFARAHDYIAQATYPGHMGMKLAEVLNFLAFQHGDFKTRAEGLEKQIEADKKAKLSVVDVPAAEAATHAVLADENGAFEGSK